MSPRPISIDDRKLKMTKEPQTYGVQMKWLARAMAEGHKEAIRARLTNVSNEKLGMFIEGNQEKRHDKLRNQLESVADHFDDFETLIRQYAAEVPLIAYDNGTSDGQHMLEWLVRMRDTSDEQRDWVACQQARHRVEELGRGHRISHIQFQDLRGVIDLEDDSWTSDTGLRIHLNPIRVWERFITSALLDDEATSPADVLFFPIGNEVTTAVLEPEGQVLVTELAKYEPCTLSEWAVVSQHADREQLIELCHDLADMGLIALG